MKRPGAKPVAPGLAMPGAAPPQNFQGPPRAAGGAEFSSYALQRMQRAGHPLQPKMAAALKLMALRSFKGG